MSNINNNSIPSILEKSNDLLKPYAKYLDQFVYEPMYESLSKSNDPSQSSEKNPINKLVNVNKINNRIEFLKLGTFAFAVLSLFMFIRKFPSNPIIGLLYLPLSVDSFHISYNCYIKKYMATSTFLLAGNLSALGSTMMKITTSALGLSKQNDPILQLEHGIYWDAVFHQSIVQKIYQKFKEYEKKK